MKVFTIGICLMGVGLAFESSAVAPLAEKLIAYRSFQKEPRATGEFADMGYVTRCFFAGNTLNSLGGPYCEYRPIWIGEGKYDFAAFDEQMQDLLSASPKANFICIIDLNTPPWLTRKYGCDSFSDITQIGFNEEWRADTVRWMDDFVKYAESKYGRLIKGYLLSGGGTSEWYEYDRGRTSRAKNAQWVKWCKERGVDYGPEVPRDSWLRQAGFENLVYDPMREPEKIEYWRFHNSIPAEALLHFVKQARKLLPRPKQIGVFFGYYHVQDSLQISFGHLDYLKVFDSPDIDFVVAPGIYANRGMGGGSGSQTILGSLRLRGKRFMHEIDFWPSTKVPPWLQKELGHGYFLTEKDDVAGNMREAAFALINNASWWWFDMFGDFYTNRELLEKIAQIRKVEQKYTDDQAMSIADVLLIADPECIYYLNESNPRARGFGQHFARETSTSGAVTDIYSFDDLSRMNLSQYKVVIMPSTIKITPDRERLLKNLVCRDGRVVVWSYAPGLIGANGIDVANVQKWAGVAFKTPGVSVTDMGDWKAVYAYDYKLYNAKTFNQIFAEAGVNLYVGEPATVFANEKMLAIHLKNGGEKTIRLPFKVKKATELLTGKMIAEDVDSFKYEFATPDTAIFSIEK